MIELLRTNNQVMVSFAEALLKDAGIPYDVLDQHMSVLEGSIGVLPRRLAVHDEDAVAARRLLIDAGIDVPPIGESRY
ncbi:DUF2007 domain-containing protein [Pyruvatibacter sp.]|uniref:putative signal transducing protein n=1 Tax=Pyruvatibacter sp. TaxID=1981328 RepID=UPI0032EB2DBC